MNQRASIVLLTLAVAFIGLGARLYAVQVSQHDRWRSERDAQVRGFVDLRGPRGSLRDARGDLLAVSVPVQSVYIVPSQVRDFDAIAAATGVDVRSRLPDPREFIWIKRGVSDEDAARIRSMRLAGVGLRTEYVRRYPQGNVGAHVVGIVNRREDDGLEGMEGALDDVLAGRTGRRAVAVDGRRRPLSAPEGVVAGSDVDLTIDLVLQRIVEEELDAMVAKYRPNWAVAVVMDPRTGAIVALANRPTFDPNAPVTDARSHQNLAVTAPYEPGSTWKPFVVAGALEEKLLTPRSVIDCENGLWRHGARILHDHHPYGSLTVTDIVAKSSNIGAAKIGALTLGRNRLHKWAAAFGFGEKTSVELPLEDRGKLVSLARWNEFTSTSVPMGHEIGVTVLQLTNAMCAIANGGKLMKPYVIKRAGGWVAKPVVLRDVLSAKTCEQMRDMLVEVVKSGTGQKAAVDGVAVAGKTGTTQKYDPALRRYTHERHISSFVGYAPAEKPRLCIAVVVDEPKGEYYGGAVAAPVVGNILRRGLPHVK